MKIIIADDHFLVLDGLELLLSTFEFVQSVGRSSDYNTLKRELENSEFDILLLDINFGNYDGREIVPEIKKMYPEIKIIALTSFDDLNTVKSAISAGFDGYLLKIDGREEIKNALYAVKSGEKYFSPKTQHSIFNSSVADINEKLTPRELEVLELIVQEKTTKEIAEILHLSEKTIESHRGNIMLKMDVRNIAGMVRKAIILGLVKINF